MSQDIEQKFRHGFGTHLSYSFGSFFDDFIMTAFSIRVYSFYETELLLPGVLVSIAVAIYGFWNMVNDPLMGYLSDKKFNFTRKLGNRFTYFLISSFPTAVIYLLIFIVPGTNQWLHFSWLLVMICLYDTAFSLWNTNWMAVFPKKFRSQKERTRVAFVQTILSQIGLTAGMLVPPLFITYGARETYIYAAMFVSFTVMVAILIMLPGMKKEKEPELMPTEQYQEAKLDKNYFQTIGFALKQKNFIAYLTAYLAQTVMMTVMLASLPYLTKYILNNVDLEFYMSAAVLIGGLLSAPLWIFVGRRLGNRIGYMFGTGLTSTLLFVFFFLSTNWLSVVICALMVGFTMGATWSLMYPTFSDVIDELVVKMGKRSEGIFYGFRTFIGRFSIVIQAITFGLIHHFTNFQPQFIYQLPPAALGIRIHTAIIPAAFYLFGFLMMWLVYDLTPEKTKQNKIRLMEMKL
jgi:GPH family glycoside/pentoside/hexuronide:cation symporter